MKKNLNFFLSFLVYIEPLTNTEYSVGSTINLQIETSDLDAREIKCIISNVCIWQPLWCWPFCSRFRLRTMWLFRCPKCLTSARSRRWPAAASRRTCRASPFRPPTPTRRSTWSAAARTTRPCPSARTTCPSGNRATSKRQTDAVVAAFPWPKRRLTFRSRRPPHRPTLPPTPIWLSRGRTTPVWRPPTWWLCNCVVAFWERKRWWWAWWSLHASFPSWWTIATGATTDGGSPKVSDGMATIRIPASAETNSAREYDVRIAVNNNQAVFFDSQFDVVSPVFVITKAARGCTIKPPTDMRKA